MTTMRLISFLGLFIFGFSIKPAYAEIFVGVTSDKEVKTLPVIAAFKEIFPNETITIMKFKASSGVPNQPVSRIVGELGAKNRLHHAKQQAIKEGLLEIIQYWVSTENFLENPDDLLAQTFQEDGKNHETSKTQVWFDRAAIILEDGSGKAQPTYYSDSATLPIQYVKLACSKGQVLAGGFSVTGGEIVHQETGLPSGNWHQGEAFGGVARNELIRRALVPALRTMIDQERHSDRRLSRL